MFMLFFRKLLYGILKIKLYTKLNHSSVKKKIIKEKLPNFIKCEIKTNKFF